MSSRSQLWTAAADKYGQQQIAIDSSRQYGQSRQLLAGADGYWQQQMAIGSTKQLRTAIHKDNLPAEAV